jgi:hypothetical protein
MLVAVDRKTGKPIQLKREMKFIQDIKNQRKENQKEN